jgi:proteasome lid subunit RPN8/RPN11
VSRIDYPPDLVRDLARLCEADPSRECCGFVVRNGHALEVVQVQNVADQYHRVDPARFPRTSRDSYLMDGRALLRLHEDLARTGGAIVAAWHSHVDAGAYFSEKDRADALLDGQQILPGAEYLVFSVRGGRVVDGKRFRYREGQFFEADLGSW